MPILVGSSLCGVLASGYPGRSRPSLTTTCIPSPGGFPATLSKSQTFMHPSINDVSTVRNAFFTFFKVICQISKLYFCAKISKYYKAPLGKLSFETGGLDSFNQYFLISLKKDVTYAIEKKKRFMSWWYMLIISAFKRVRHENCREFQTSLGYTTRPCSQENSNKETIFINRIFKSVPCKTPGVS